MKKSALILIMVIALAGTAFSQIKLGVRGGVNFNNIKMIEQPSGYQLSYEPGMGFHFGMTSQFSIIGLFIQPELLFSTLTNDVTLDDLSANGIDEVGKQRYNKVDVPILAGIKFSKFKIGVGPVFSAIVNSKSEVLDDDTQKGATVGYQMGAGFDFDKFNIELRYEGNLSKYGTGVKIGGTTYDFDQRINQIILTTAFYF